MWRAFIEQCGGTVHENFPVNTLAHVSMGYSAGSIKKACEFVLTPFRKERLEERPLRMTEFIGPLSMCMNTLDD